VVAEVRQHHANMTSNTALMLRSNLAALQTQWRYVKANPEYTEAYRAGLRFWRTHYGGRLATEIPDQIRLGQWKRALSGRSVIHTPELAGALRLVSITERKGAPCREGPQESDAADNGGCASASRWSGSGRPRGIPPL
jgi:hypothetical protein